MTEVYDPSDLDDDWEVSQYYFFDGRALRNPYTRDVIDVNGEYDTTD